MNCFSILTNGNLLGYKSVIINDLNIYIIQEVNKKSTSANSISKTIRWTYEAIGNAIASIVKAIHYLHQNNIAHGHLKTSSVFVTEQNVWKVADYFLVPYLHYLSNKTNTSCFVPNKSGDLKAIAQLIASFDIQSGALNDFVRLCKTSIDIKTIINDPLFEKISKFSRLEAEFEIESYLEEGAFGDVLKVKSYTDNREYAIKRVKLQTKNSSEFNKAKKEARSLSKLKHSNIVQYHTSWTESVDESVFNSYKPSNGNYMDVAGFGHNNIVNIGYQTVGVLYIQMELCDIKDLSYLIEERNLRGNAERLIRYSKQILEGLCYMHSKKLIHCDLKPDNILLNDDQIKISDFGLTSTTRSVLERYRSGNTSSIHIAPEFLTNNTRTQNGDMYSFGIVLFEMCFGPFQNNNERLEMLKMIEEDNPIPHKYIHHSIYHVLIEIMRAVLIEDARKRLPAKTILQKLKQLECSDWYLRPPLTDDKC
ncbi:uncharacterized protein LOC129566456 isoform X2 [Sitodiplosis mosellana]|nr:uncharacterized protein LOC129566456 isoform X2 [Sitodiplosis mosellana]